MKLPIKQEQFDQIKKGAKTIEYRDAHITFVCEETGEIITKEVEDCVIKTTRQVLDQHPDYSKFFDDEYVIAFYLSNKKVKF